MMARWAPAVILGVIVLTALSAAPLWRESTAQVRPLQRTEGGYQRLIEIEFRVQLAARDVD